MTRRSLPRARSSNPAWILPHSTSTTSSICLSSESGSTLDMQMSSSMNVKTSPRSSISCLKSFVQTDLGSSPLENVIKRSMDFEELMSDPWTISKIASECLNFHFLYPTGVHKMSSKKRSNIVLQLNGEITRQRATSASVVISTGTKIHISSHENSSCAVTMRRSFERFFGTLEKNLPVGSYRISLTLSRDSSETSNVPTLQPYLKS